MASPSTVTLSHCVGMAPPPDEPAEEHRKATRISIEQSSIRACEQRLARLLYCSLALLFGVGPTGEAPEGVGFAQTVGRLPEPTTRHTDRRLAEGVGFEPTAPINAGEGFQDRPDKPLPYPS